MDISRRTLLTSSAAAAALGAVGLAAGPGAGAAVRTASAAAIVDSMTLEQQVGQMFAVEVPFGAISTAQHLIEWYSVGTIFLHGRTHAGTAAVARQSAAMQRAVSDRTTRGVREFIATDQEGGYVQSLNGPGVSDIPTALAQARQSDETVRYRAALWSRQLKRAGINLNLAPVAGVVPSYDKATNDPIGHFDREFGSTPAAVARAVANWVPGSLSAGVQVTLKHFPGLGRVRGNTDTESHVVDDQTYDNETTLSTFRTGLHAGAGVIMVSSAIYYHIDPHGQAFVSPTVIQGMIRRQLGFDGIVMTDEIGNAAAVQNIPPADRATRFVHAGGDLVLTSDLSTVSTMRNAVISQARRDSGFAARVRQSATRVVSLKARTGLTP